MRRLRLLTAGESHGPAVSGVLEGLPYGLKVSTPNVNRDLRRRQHGYGSGRRMLIEQDQAAIGFQHDVKFTNHPKNSEWHFE